MGAGKDTLNVIVFYGVSAQRLLNQQLIESVLECRARLGNAATVMAGDWNANLDSPPALHPSMVSMLSSGMLVDLDREYAKCSQMLTQASFHGGVGSPH